MTNDDDLKDNLRTTVEKTLLNFVLQKSFMRLLFLRKKIPIKGI